MLTDNPLFQKLLLFYSLLLDINFSQKLIRRQFEVDELIKKKIPDLLRYKEELRNKENIKSEFTFIGVKESSVENYEKIKDNLFATVKFIAEVISVKKDKENKIIEGNPDKIKFVTDSWKFTRNIKQKDPNWYLSEIISK